MESAMLESATPAFAGAFESPFQESDFRPGQAGNGPGNLLGAALSPFADNEDPSGLGEANDLLGETYAELRDEGFHEAISSLAEETEAAIDERFEGEGPTNPADRERFARSYLAPAQFEADQYLASLEAGLFEADPATLSPEALDEVLERFDPMPGDLSPASEEFIGKLVKKARRVVRKVAATARQVGKLASPFLKPLLKRLRALVRPLLERVLRFAIGKLPQPLQPRAKILADRILGKTMSSAVTASATSADPSSATAPAPAPAQGTDTEELADSFDLTLAEALAFPDSLEASADQFGEDQLGAEQDAAILESEELEALAEARDTLIDHLAASESSDALAPRIEQFVPVVLAALRTGIGIVGRPRVVSFLADYLAKMVQQWIGAQDSRPLSRAIVDAGLKMISLEAEGGSDAASGESGPIAWASVIEDTVRRLAEAEDYLFEDPNLAEVAVGDAFAEAAATYLPQETIREELQLAPSLGGAFVTRRARRPRSFAKYSRVPEVTISARAADALPAFRGGNLGAAVRAAGGRFPFRARMHIFQARPGATVAAMMRHGLPRTARTMGALPLTPQAAGVLLGEPGLGAAGAARYLRTPRRISAGQRLYVLEPLDQAVTPRPDQALSPGRAWVAINARKARITLGFYISEGDAQLLAGALRSGRGHAEVLRRILHAHRFAAQRQEAGSDETHEEGEDFERFAARAGNILPPGYLPALRKRIAVWALPALSAWLKNNTDSFLRAAAHPDPGVRLRIRLSHVPGLAKAVAGGTRPTLAALDLSLRGMPTIDISVTPGSHRR